MPNKTVNLDANWKSPTELPPDDVQVLAELKPRRKNMKPILAVVEYMRTRKGVHDAEPMWFTTLSDDDVEVLRWRYLVELTPEQPKAEVDPDDPAIPKILSREEIEQLTLNSDRYKKLRGYMSSNVPEGWKHVENLAAVAAYMSWETMDQELDALPECNLGLCAKPATAA